MLLQKLEDCLNEFSIITNVNDIPKLAALPPAFQTIPCKPTFFDISLNHIGMPCMLGSSELYYLLVLLFFYYFGGCNIFVAFDVCYLIVHGLLSI